MKKLGYYFFKYWILLGLFFYYKRIHTIGLDRVPKNKPVILLSNHQNALLDVLLIATRNNLRPWFLTRADVFKNKLFTPLFYFLQMLPIYRMRDGKGTLEKNYAIFDRCGALLNNNKTLLIFPEANQNLKRRVRPLSKGFTRLIFDALKKNPKLDLQLVPVGQNYKQGNAFPDSAALYFGKPIAVQDLICTNRNESTVKIKSIVTRRLKELTTHIEHKKEYDAIERTLKDSNVDFLNPILANKLLEKGSKESKKKMKNIGNPLKWIVILINLPIVFIWRTAVKPKVPELEFMSTFRFAFSMLVYPVFYALLAFVLTNFYDIKTAGLIVLAHTVLNIFLIKIGFTSSAQKR